ncbi:MAG: S1 RNA-binding domain-containing protein [Oscillospiraceae bacterium]|nr:S1 RNA-binding domain-containing protein [Oscillospiraceae bacterium]
MRYTPEGFLLHSPANIAALGSVEALAAAARAGTICEAVTVRCDTEHRLYVFLPTAPALPALAGVIEREEGALGIAEGTVRDIALLSRVGKPVCFTVLGIEDGMARLSRRAAQARCMDEYVRRLHPGDIIPARVTRLEPFGAFCDIGCGLPALLPIAALSVSRISHPRDRLAPGQDIFAVVSPLSQMQEGRVFLSLRELLGTWEENAAAFRAGETVTGVVRSLESYGVFIELAPNLAGLAEATDGVRVGQTVTVCIKSLQPEKMKIKLAILDAGDMSGVGGNEGGTDSKPAPLPYTATGGHIERWRYSPEGCARVINSEFEMQNAE